MADVIGLEEPRRIGSTMRGVQADLRVVLSRVDGLGRRMAVLEERQAELETGVRELRDGMARLDRKLDVIIAVIGAGRPGEPPASA